jgi:hypothetical protein
MAKIAITLHKLRTIHHSFKRGETRELKMCREVPSSAMCVATSPGNSYRQNQGYGCPTLETGEGVGIRQKKLENIDPIEKANRMGPLAQRPYSLPIAIDPTREGVARHQKIAANLGCGETSGLSLG